MNSKEIIKRVIEFNNPPRIGFDFNTPYLSDMYGVGLPFEYTKWGYDENMKKQVPHFSGQVMKDPFGNIWGRLEDISKGESIKGALQDGWDMLKDYKMPEIDDSWADDLKDKIDKNKEKYIIGYLPGFTFSIMRTIRGMENFLMDVLTEKENVIALGNKVMDFLDRIIDLYGKAGVDGIMFAEDWGTQNSLLISPKCWRQIFKPWFKRMADKSHGFNMHVIMHSCGYIYDIIGDLVETGIDALQLDQPALMGDEALSENYGGKITFYCPVDIQKIMQTGDRKIIEDEARNMINLFGRFNGGFIAKDYPQWDAINVKEEWAMWARDIFLNEGLYVQS